jgi:hypothetical protein
MPPILPALAPRSGDTNIGALQSATASRRNPGGYGFWKFDPLGMRTSSSPDRTVPTKRSGVHESGGIPRHELRLVTSLACRGSLRTRHAEALSPLLDL